MNHFFDLLPLVLLLPLLVAMAIGAKMLSGRGQGDAAEPATARWASTSALIGVLVLLGACLAAVTGEAPGRVELARWIESGPIALTLALSIDIKSLVFALIVQFVGWITLRFSRTYLHREAAFHRFFLGMNLFLCGMQIIVLAGDAAFMLIGWELVGLSSWLLIGYDAERSTATGNAVYAFVTNRIGDAGFILGIALAFLWLGSTAWPALGVAVTDGALDKVSARMLLFGFFIAAVAKSAQLPLSGWLARALEGPTPSSAIFYGAIMVHAGVWMLIRLEPLLRVVPDIMVQVAIFGALTALYGWLTGLVQTDVKSSLVFATTTQIGLMFLACGLGYFEFAFWHMCCHAVLRAAQFLLAPSYMHLLMVPSIVPPTLPPTWLRDRSRWYAAAVSRFWIEPLALTILIRPVQTMARDLRALDDRILMPLLAPDENSSPTDGGRSLGKIILVWAANACAAIEEQLTQVAGSGVPARVMRQIGEYFLEFEALLERPRYLLLLVAITFMVIL